MLASQLCVFHDRTDLKWKESKSMVPLSKLSSLCEDIAPSVMLCCRAISLMIWCMQSECVMPSLKELEQWKLSSSTTVDKFITKETPGSSVKCWVHCGKIKNFKSKIPSINYKYFASNITLVLRDCRQITFVTLNRFFPLNRRGKGLSTNNFRHA